MRKSENRLLPENCNIRKCKSCMFGLTPIRLAQERMNEITDYLATGSASHICHVTNKTCYGALEFQAKIFHFKGILTEPTVKCLLETAAVFLNLKNEKTRNR